MVDGPDLEIHGLERAKRPFDRAQSLVVAHGITAAHRPLSNTRTDDIDAVEPHLGSNLLATQREIEAFIRDGELEVLGDLVLVHHLARPHPNGAAPLELATRNHFAHLLELLGDRAQPGGARARAARWSPQSAARAYVHAASRAPECGRRRAVRRGSRGARARTGCDDQTVPAAAAHHR